MTRLARFNVTINGSRYSVEAQPDTPLVWILRDTLGLTGTKFGCGIAQCGACTVHVNGKASRSCVLPISSVEGMEILTIEALSESGNHPLQRAWVAEKVPQCGYCQAGQIMQAADLLAKNPKPTDAEILSAMRGNLCRCGTYQRILRAIRRAAKQKPGVTPES